MMVRAETSIGEQRYGIELRQLASILDVHADVAKRRNLEPLERQLRDAAHAAASWSQHVEDVHQLVAHHSPARAAAGSRSAGGLWRWRADSGGETIEGSAVTREGARRRGAVYSKLLTRQRPRNIRTV